jgi:hypothetical protein
MRHEPPMEHGLYALRPWPPEAMRLVGVLLTRLGGVVTITQDEITAAPTSFVVAPSLDGQQYEVRALRDDPESV